MEGLWLNHWKSNDWTPYCCYSCINQEPEWPNNRIRCDKWILMNPNEFCTDFSLDSTKTCEEIIDFIQQYIAKNSWI